MSFILKDISYKYTEDTPYVLKNINFEILPEKVTVLVGASGSGKSTLVQIISEAIPKLLPNGILEGSFESDDNVLIGVVGQTPENQLFGYGVEDAIVFGMENMGLSSEEIDERLEYVLDLLNLQYLRKRSVATLSGGQKQSVCIASVVAMNPDILIMDEPVSSLDPKGKAMVMDVIMKLRDAKTTIVISDSNLEWSTGCVDHVIGLQDGEIIFSGTKNDFFKDFELQHNLEIGRAHV